MKEEIKKFITSCIEHRNSMVVKAKFNTSLTELYDLFNHLAINKILLTVSEIANTQRYKDYVFINVQDAKRFEKWNVSDYKQLLDDTSGVPKLVFITYDFNEVESPIRDRCMTVDLTEELPAVEVVKESRPNVEAIGLLYKAATTDYITLGGCTNEQLAQMFALEKKGWLIPAIVPAFTVTKGSAYAISEKGREIIQNIVNFLNNKN